jgi:hypothetical protein
MFSRRVHLAGCTPTPSAEWVTQQARQLTWSLSDRPEPVRYVIRDRDQKFTNTFDEVFRSAGCEIIRTPFALRRQTGWRSASYGPYAQSGSTGC